MAGYERIRDRGSALGRQLGIECGRQLRIARTASGLSQAAIAKAAGLSTALVSRIERGLVPGVSLPVLARLFTAVGLRLTVKAYPDGDAIRDAPQTRVLSRFRSLLPPHAHWKVEVPLPITGDRRAWDGWTRSGGTDIGVEVETGLNDAQAVLRRTELKQRDGQMDRVRAGAG